MAQLARRQHGVVGRGQLLERGWSKDRSRSSKGIFRHVSQVPADERAVEEGIPVTSVHRTIFDLAPTDPARSAFQDDRARDRVLHASGFSVIHLTWSQLDVEPEAIASDLRRLLQR